MIRWLKRIAWLIAGLLVVAALGVAAAQTGLARQWIARIAGSAASSPGMIVTIGAIEGFLPFDMTVRTVTVADDEGPWLSVDRAALRWSPTKLLARRIQVDALEAGRIALHRLPAADAAAASSERGSFSLPRDLPAVDIGRIAIERIEIEEPVLGEAMVLDLSASASLAAGAARARLDLRRLDGAGHVALDLTYAPEANRLEAKLDAVEPSGRLADRLLERDDRLPIRIALDGAGPLQDWRGRLAATIGEAARADLALAVAGDTQRRIAVDGTLHPGPLLPEEWREAVGAEIRLRLAAIVAEEAVTVEALEASVAGLALTGSGRRSGDGTLAATIDATVADLRPIGAAIDLALAGSAHATFAIAGTDAAPTVTARIDGRDLVVDDLRAKALSFTADARREDGAVTVSAEGRLLSPETGADLPPIGDVDWSLAGRIADDGAIRIERASVRAPSIALDAAGARSVDGGIDGTLDARIERALLSHVGSPVLGTAAVRATARQAADGAIDATLSGSLERPEGEATLVALIGDRLTWSAATAYAADGTIRIRDLVANGRNVGLDGAATIAPDGQIETTARLRLPRLEALAAPLGRAIAGSATIDAALRGDPSRPTGTVRLASPSLTLDGQRLLRLDGQIGLRADADAIVAAIEAKAESEGLPVTVAATVRAEGIESIAIENLRATAGGTRVGGRLVLADLMPAEGRLSVEAADFSSLAPLIGARIGGSGKLDLRLDRGVRPKLVATARIERLVLPDLTTGGITLDATIDDPLGRAAGSASLEARVIAAGGQTVDRLKIDARGSLAEGLRTRLSATARLPKPASTEITAQIQRTGSGVRAAVSAAEVRVDGRRIFLGAPLQLAWSAGVATADNLDLRLEEGRVTGRGRLAPDGAAVDLTIARLPLNTIGRIAGVPRLVGRLDGRVAVDTGGTAPNGRIDLDATGLRWRGAGRDLPAVAIHAEGRWSEGRARLTAALRETSDASLSLAADVPLVRRAAPFDLAMPGEGMLRVRADGQAELARLQRYLPVEGFAMAGRLDLALTVDGTVAAPRPGGRAQLANGRIEEGASGVVLSALQAVLVGDGQRFRLESLQAQDGSGGRIAATGEARRADSGWQAEAAIDLTRFRVLANDLGTARASGRIGFRADPKGARIAGETRVDQGEIRIPDKAPPTLVPIRVVEVNKPGAGTVDPAPDAPDLPIALAVQVEIPGRLFVRGRGSETEWRGSLQVGGTIADPRVSGRIQTVRGRYDLLGRRFTVERGVIAFDGAPTEAGLDVRAVANANEIEATVAVTGSVTNPVLALGSNPPLPQDEVLSRVLFGKGTTQITAGQAVQLAQAAGELAGLGGGPGILDRVRQRLGLDTLDVGGQDGTSVTLGRYVAEDVFVKVNPNPGSDGSNVVVEIQVLPNLTVDTGVGGSGTSVGVKYRLDY